MKKPEWRSWSSYRQTEDWLEELPKGGDLPWALFYPADYSIGSSSLGFQYIFRQLRKSGIAVERFFAAGANRFRSVDADTMIERFSIITASVAFEGNVPVFYKWLHEAGIPLSPFDREKDAFPIVGVGGALTYINPLCFSSVCDFVLLGDGIDVIDYLIDCLRTFLSGGTRKAFWSKLAESPFIFVPPVDISNGGIARKLSIARALDLNNLKYPVNSVWQTPMSVFSDTLLVELQRGCARGCNYCTLPKCFGRMRFRDYNIIEAAIDRITEKHKIRQIGLVTPEAGDYPFLHKLIDKILAKNIGISFASLRVDKLDEIMINALTVGGRKSITIAPETGCEKLRFLCGKKFTDELIIEKLKIAKKYGITHVKLYFMIGLPGECDSDIEAIASLCGNIYDETKQEITISVNPFIPKPYTPWQLEEFSDKLQIRKKYDILQKSVKHLKKQPQLRLTGAREACDEFNLAWSGIDENRKFADNIICGTGKVVQANRQRTADELKNFV